MKIKKSVLALLCCSVLFVATGCSTQVNNGGGNTTAEKPASPDIVGEVSLKNPIVINKENKSVTVLSQVNGKYFTEPTRHASVFKDGTNGTKSIFTAYATAEQFYNGLKEVGAEPGENMTPDNKTTTHVKGDKIKAEVTWFGADKSYDINEVVKDNNGKPISFRFGGNLKRAIKVNTGCLTCLDSCPVGIISNESYTYGAVETRGEVEFTGNKDVLPEDGTYVAITYTVDK